MIIWLVSRGNFEEWEAHFVDVRVRSDKSGCRYAIHLAIFIFIV